MIEEETKSNRRRQEREKERIRKYEKGEIEIERGGILAETILCRHCRRDISGFLQDKSNRSFLLNFLEYPN
jgi:hypothetical protein